MTERHFYQPPPDPPCVECGLSIEHGNHALSCRVWWVSTHPGSPACRLMEGHDGPHEMVLYDNSVWVVEDDGEGKARGEGEMIEQPRWTDLASIMRVPGAKYGGD